MLKASLLAALVGLLLGRHPSIPFGLVTAAIVLAEVACLAFMHDLGGLRCAANLLLLLTVSQAAFLAAGLFLGDARERSATA